MSIRKECTKTAADGTHARAHFLNRVCRKASPEATKCSLREACFALGDQRRRGIDLLTPPIRKPSDHGVGSAPGLLDLLGRLRRAHAQRRRLRGRRRAVIAVGLDRFRVESGSDAPTAGARLGLQSGANEVYVRVFTTDFSGGSAGAGGSVLVSRSGGTAPRWRGDGRELFYLAPDGKMMAAEIPAAHEVHAGVPAPLFHAPPGAIVGDVSADGRRFLLVAPTGHAATTPFTVVRTGPQG